MIPKKNRTTQKIIDLIFKQGKFINSQNISLKFFLNKESPIVRTSFVVPKNIVKSAVKRNMLRRRGYQVISKYLNDLPVGFSGAFIFGKNSKDIFGSRGVNKEKAFENLDKEVGYIVSVLNK
jgi:ribonuclease P protein component